MLLLEQSSSVDLEDGDRRKLAREIAQLESGAQGMQQLCELKSEALSLQALREDPEAEAELQQMATEELVEVDAARRQLEKQLLHSLIPKDDVEDGNVMLEIRAGAGGDEASIFAADLYNMYSKYAFSLPLRLPSLFAHCS
jgi:peptide chain release factor 1